MTRFTSAPGKPVAPPEGAAVAHEHEAFGGGKVVVGRDARGRLLPGNTLHKVRNPSNLGRSIVHPESMIRRALGLPNHKRRPKA